MTTWIIICAAVAGIALAAYGIIIWALNAPDDHDQDWWL